MSAARTALQGFLLAVFLAPTGWTGERFAGVCVAVGDGDTVEVMRDGRAVRVRVWGIDCPEQGQPFGTAARRFTAAQVFRRTVTVEVMGTDRYGRIVGRVSVAGRDLGLELVREGLAWWLERHAPHASDLAAAQREARASRRGLWSDPRALPPAAWRQRHPRTPQADSP